MNEMNLSGERDVTGDMSAEEIFNMFFGGVFGNPMNRHFAHQFHPAQTSHRNFQRQVFTFPLLFEYYSICKLSAINHNFPTLWGLSQIVPVRNLSLTASSNNLAIYNLMNFHIIHHSIFMNSDS